MVRTDWMCLEFTKTRGWEARDTSDEVLTDYAALIGWVERAGGLTKQERQALAERARARPGDAHRVLERAIELRRALYALFAALGRGDQAPKGEIEALNGWVGRVAPQRALRSRGRRFAWEWVADEPPPLERPLWPVVQSAADLLTSPELGRVRLCDADDCGWLFVDASKNRSRRWCDMSDCGNRAKVRRFRARQRAGG